MSTLAMLYLDPCRPWCKVGGNGEEGKGCCHSLVGVGGVGEVLFDFLQLQNVVVLVKVPIQSIFFI